MHRTINIKHRIVRRVDILKAPLATFDTIDLGDEDDVTSSFTELAYSDKQENCPGLSVLQDSGGNESLKTETIGGNNSKKSLSHAGGDEKEAKSDQLEKETDDKDVSRKEVKDGTQGVDSCTLERSPEIKASCLPVDKSTTQTNPQTVNKHTTSSKGGHTFTRQATLGRVKVPLKKQDSESSSEGEQSNISFQSSRPSIDHIEALPRQGTNQETESESGNSTSLLPDNIDPSQILSPSKRKAYERRIERLKVTTSPIARPRSTAPISVVTLDEYASISSPDASPASPSTLPNKLKITLPSDEFTTKPKTLRSNSSRSRRDSGDVAFEFTEEILFSRTKSALVVNEAGQLPPSPRRVLLPPTLTPASTPILTSPQHPDSTQEEVYVAPKLLYLQENKAAHKFFGDTVDETDVEDWASFPEHLLSSPNEIEAECSKSNISKENECVSTPIKVDTDGFTDDIAEVEVIQDNITTYISSETAVSESQASDAPASSTDNQNVKNPEVTNTLVYNTETDNVISVEQVQTENYCFSNADVTNINPFDSVTQQELEVEQFDSGIKDDALRVGVHELFEVCEKHFVIDIKSGESGGSANPELLDDSTASTLPDTNYPKSAATSEIQKSNEPCSQLDITLVESDKYGTQIPTCDPKPLSLSAEKDILQNWTGPPTDELCSSQLELQNVSCTNPFLRLETKSTFSPVSIVTDSFHSQTNNDHAIMFVEDHVDSIRQSLDDSGLGLLQPFSNPVSESFTASSDLIDFSSSLDDPSA